MYFILKLILNMNISSQFLPDHDNWYLAQAKAYTARARRNWTRYRFLTVSFPNN